MTEKDWATESIKVRKSTKQALWDISEKGESFDDVIKRLLIEYQKVMKR